MAAKAQRPAEREAGLFERSIFLDRQLYSSCERAAKEIVSENWNAVATLAEMLLRQPVVNRTDLDSLRVRKP